MQIAETAIRECVPAAANGCGGDLIVRAIPCDAQEYYECCDKRPLVLVHRLDRTSRTINLPNGRCAPEFTVKWGIDYLRCVQVDECGCEAFCDVELLDDTEDALVSAFTAAGCQQYLGKCEDVGVESVNPLCPATAGGGSCKGFRIALRTCPDTPLNDCCVACIAGVE